MKLLTLLSIFVVSHSFRHFKHPTASSPKSHSKLTTGDKSITKLVKLQGGLESSAFEIVKAHLTSSPTALFNSLLIALLSSTAVVKIQENLAKKKSDNGELKPIEVTNLQQRFLMVFWLLRMADWLQGPYFYEVYSSKIINGIQVTPDLVSKLFLVGFASTGLLGPWIGSFVDNLGRKAGTLAFVLFYVLGALSTASNNLLILLLGRFSSGIGTSLLHSAPESWLVGEHQKKGFEGKWLGQTFGWAYAGDSIVAISAGQLAALTAATQLGASGPFLLSIGFLAAGGLIAGLRWHENIAPKSEAGTNQVSVADALSVIKNDKKILLVGAVQALFEGAMYIFVLQWPPAVKAAIAGTSWLSTGVIPYGTIFSCFMASCLLGSSIFSRIQSRLQSEIEIPAAIMLGTAAVAMTVSTAFGLTNLAILSLAFFVFEACVGMYFPSIGTLRSKYIPDSHRSVIMNIFGVPLNLVVVSVFLSIKALGVSGALTCAAGALGLSAACMMALCLTKFTKVLNVSEAADTSHSNV